MDSKLDRLMEALTESNTLMAEAALELENTTPALANELLERVQLNAEVLREVSPG